MTRLGTFRDDVEFEVFLCAQRYEAAFAKGVRCWYGCILFLEGDSGGIAREAVEVGPVEGSELFEVVEFFDGIECFRVEFDGRVSCEDAGATAGAFFVVEAVGRRVGAEEEFGIPGSGRLEERLAMDLGF